VDGRAPQDHADGRIDIGSLHERLNARRIERPAEAVGAHKALDARRVGTKVPTNNCESFEEVVPHEELERKDIADILRAKPRRSDARTGQDVIVCNGRTRCPGAIAENVHTMIAAKSGPSPPAMVHSVNTHGPTRTGCVAQRTGAPAVTRF